MSKTKLRKLDRERILVQVKALLNCPKEEKAHNTALAVAVDALSPLVDKKFNRAEMMVLNKYDSARRDFCGKVAVGKGNRIVGFHFGRLQEVEITQGWQKGKLRTSYDTTSISFEGFLVPRGNCHLGPFSVSEAIGKKIEKYNFAQLALFEAIKAKTHAYKTVVGSARYVEDIEEIIDLPAEFYAELKLRDSGLPAVSASVLNIVTADRLAA